MRPWCKARWGVLAKQQPVAILFPRQEHLENSGSPGRQHGKVEWPVMPQMPAKIGPYTILDRLGAGGMGEVFAARDERLKRNVAIKRLHPENALVGERLARFRREAQLAARLNHPAIVQIHDVIEHEGSELIVMEFVDGESLAQRLAAGPLAIEPLLRLALDVIDGLAAAHEQGVIHRDLKTENVLITATGRAKITDFGIAKSLDPDADDPRLTATSDVVGTRRAMAPEQIRGEPLDERTDLHAFGVLLYEALTGSSPFSASSVVRTISRILDHTPTPVQAIDRQIPSELSALVTYLLRKDPNLRPRSAVEVREILARIATQISHESEDPEATTLTRSESLSVEPTASRSPSRGGRFERLTAAILATLVLLVLGFVAVQSWRQPPPQTTVAVMQPNLATPGPPWSLVALGVQAASLSGLASHPSLAVKAPSEVELIAGTPRQVALAEAVDEVITTDLECSGASCQVALTRIDGHDGQVLASRSFVIPAEDFHASAAIVTTQVLDAFDYRSTTTGAIPSSDALETYLRLRERREATGATPELSAELAALRERSGDFLEALLLEADILRRRFADSRDPKDLTHAGALFQRAENLAPRDPRPLSGRCRALIAGGQLDEARAVLDELEQRLPGTVEVLDLRSYLLRKRGQIDEALAVLRQAARQQPSWKRLSNLAALEARHGDIDAARNHLQESLRRFPGNLAGLSRLAQIELVSGDPERAIKLYRQLVEKSPSLPELSNLGLAYLLTGRYQESAETYRQVLDREPDNPMFTLNLADALQLVGDDETAGLLYQRVLTLAEADPETSAWQLLTVKAQALGHLGRHREAVAATQRALQLAPGNSQAAFEATLVYCLAGEHASAAFNAEQALELGFAKRWFALPWFDGLRRYDPSFGS